jgi:hypothetical protein
MHTSHVISCTTELLYQDFSITNANAKRISDPDGIDEG